MSWRRNSLHKQGTWCSLLWMKLQWHYSFELAIMSVFRNMCICYAHFITYLAHSANLSTELYILPSIISSFFNMSKAISVSTGPIFTTFSPDGRYLREFSWSSPVFPIPQGTLPWQPILCPTGLVCSEPKYLRIRWTDFCSLFTEWKRSGWWGADDRSGPLFAISQGMLPWFCEKNGILPTFIALAFRNGVG